MVRNVAPRASITDHVVDLRRARREEAPAGLADERAAPPAAKASARTPLWIPSAPTTTS